MVLYMLYLHFLPSFFLQPHKGTPDSPLFPKLPKDIHDSAQPSFLHDP